MLGGTNNTYLYISLYVFIFLAILFGLQLLSIRAEEHVSERKKKKIYDHKPDKLTASKPTEVNITDVSDVEDIFNIFNSTTSTSEVTNFDEIIATTKGRSKGEKLCRYFLEQTYQKPFPSCYPKFLINPETDSPLELDGYNEELGIAFEYNGIQHYNRVPIWQKSDAEFMYQLKKDKFKRDMCQKKGIYLITVPYTVPHEEIKECIEFNLPENVAHRRQLRKSGYDVPEEYIPLKLRN